MGSIRMEEEHQHGGEGTLHLVSSIEVELTEAL